MTRSNECANKSAAGSSKKEEISKKELMEMRERVAVRFLLKKTKRFDYSKNPPPPSTVAAPKKTIHECLYYLGLAPKSGMNFERKMKVPDKDSHLFQKPTIYECTICLKFFFHKKPLRKHMIHHMKNSYRCMWCNRGFTSLIPKRRHEFFCRRCSRK